MLGWIQQRFIADTGVFQRQVNRFPSRVGHVRVLGPEDHQKFTADFSCAGQRSGIGVLTELAIMDARAVVADRCADIGLERRSKREVPADTETHDTDFPWRDLRIYGKPVK